MHGHNYASPEIFDGPPPERETPAEPALTPGHIIAAAAEYFGQSEEAIRKSGTSPLAKGASVARKAAMVAIDELMPEMDIRTLGDEFDGRSPDAMHTYLHTARTQVSRSVERRETTEKFIEYVRARDLSMYDPYELIPSPRSETAEADSYDLLEIPEAQAVPIGDIFGAVKSQFSVDFEEIITGSELAGRYGCFATVLLMQESGYTDDEIGDSLSLDAGEFRTLARRARFEQHVPDFMANLVGARLRMEGEEVKYRFDPDHGVTYDRKTERAYPEGIRKKAIERAERLWEAGIEPPIHRKLESVKDGEPAICFIPDGGGRLIRVGPIVSRVRERKGGSGYLVAKVRNSKREPTFEVPVTEPSLIQQSVWQKLRAKPECIDDWASNPLSGHENTRLADAIRRAARAFDTGNARQFVELD